METGGGRPHVAIARKEYSLLKHYLMDLATHRRREFLEDQIRSLPYCRYAPVLAQIGIEAGSGNRTRINSLEGCGFTTKLCPHSGIVYFA